MTSLEKLYGSAVLHIAWLVTKGQAGQKGQRRLVFGYVECLPNEVPPPIDDGEHEFRLPGRVHRLYARHISLAFDVARAWYEAAIQGQVVRPNEDGSLPKFGELGTLAAPPLHEDVVWPRTLCGQRSNAPFLSLWHRTPRIHQLIPLNPWLLDELDTPAQQATVDFVHEHFGFSLTEWDAFWGSLHLVLPDPFHRSIHRGFHEAPEGEILIVRAEARRDVPIGVRPAMTLVVEEHRVAGIAGILHRTLPPEGDVRLRLSPRLSATSIRVADEEGTVYAAEEPSHFLTSVSIQGQVLHARRRILLPSRGGKPAAEYEVDVGATMIESRVGPNKSDAPSVETRLTRMFERQKVGRMAQALEQRWFYRQRKDAEEHIRALLGGARQGLFIADPYFTHHELLRYALAAKQHRLPIEILTSALAFRESGSQTGPEDFLAETVRAKADTTVGTIDIRIMGRSDLHDRFVLVDDHLYSLGGSLNEMGHRGMMIIRVPDPAPVLAELRKIWSDSPDLATWLAKQPPATAASLHTDAEHH